MKMQVLWANDKLKEEIEYRAPTTRPSYLQGYEDEFKAAKEAGSVIDITVLQREDSYLQYRKTCRLCGGSTSPLQRFDEFCNEIGETYESVLYYVTGLKVHLGSDMICLNCISQMMVAVNFKFMVCSAFEKTLSEKSSNHILGNELSNQTICAKGKQSLNNIHARNMKRKACRGITKVAVKKKTLVPCTICGLKYPIMQSEECQQFTCARCKINKTSDRTIVCTKCKTRVSSKLLNFHVEMHANSNLKGRCRLRSVPKQPSQTTTKKDDAQIKKHRFPQKFSCVRCPKKYNQESQLKDHAKTAHGIGNICPICKKDMRYPKFLERHLRVHDKNVLLECPLCHKIFKNRQIYEKHLSIHGSSWQMTRRP